MDLDPRGSPTQATLGNAFRERRLALDLTQGEVAAQIGAPGCQSQISAFENGVPNVLSEARTRAYAERIGLDLDSLGFPTGPPGAALGLCTHCDCPGNTPFVGPRGLFIVPRVARSAGSHCTMCRERWYRACQCGAQVIPGIFCGHCKHPYVLPPGDEELEHLGLSEEAWAEQRRELRDRVLEALEHSIESSDPTRGNADQANRR